MILEELRSRLAETFILPILKIGSIEDALEDIAPLILRNIRVIEIVFRTPAAAEALRSAKRRFPECLFGAGTMIDDRSVTKAIESGADFLVSPGLTPVLHQSLASSGLPVIPGVQTASEVIFAREQGYRLMKFYPSQASNGPDVLADYANIFGDVGFVATGGIDSSRLKPYASLRNIVAVGGSWILPSRQAANGPSLDEQLAQIKRWRDTR